MSDLKTLLDAALRLTPRARAELAREIMASRDQASPHAQVDARIEAAAVQMVTQAKIDRPSWGAGPAQR